MSYTLPTMSFQENVRKSRLKEVAHRFWSRAAPGKGLNIKNRYENKGLSLSSFWKIKMEKAAGRRAYNQGCIGMIDEALVSGLEMGRENRSARQKSRGK